MHRYWSRQEKCLTLCSPSERATQRLKVDAGKCSMICAKTSLPWFIGGPRNGRHHGPANAAIRVEIETRQNHKLSFANQIVIAPLALNVGTALLRSSKLIIKSA